MDLVESLLQGNRRAVARLISLAENSIERAEEIVKKIYPHTGKGFVIGVTGSPGVGKSTFISTLTKHLVSLGKRVGIIAVDPTSPFSGGALLGDRIRMKPHFASKDVFIRSMAARGMLGGISRATKDAIKILDAAGFDYVIIETVGVGQSEVEVYKAVDTTAVIVAPNMGDEIQTLKAGIMEITDIFVVNKADIEGADKQVAEIESMLDLGEKMQVSSKTHSIKFFRTKGWKPPVIKMISTTGEGIDRFFEVLETHRTFLQESENGRARKRTRVKSELLDILKDKLTIKLETLLHNEENQEIERDIDRIMEREADPYTISRIIEAMINRHK